jgi:hypothetical protein
MGRKAREPHSCITAGYSEATEATGLPSVTAFVRRWLGPPVPLTAGAALRAEAAPMARKITPNATPGKPTRQLKLPPPATTPTNAARII